ncbi:hypothetical protein MMC17_004795 [Xylographa soralifera]|nr:hypothetical protein [Xylographa soralifera]
MSRHISNIQVAPEEDLPTFTSSVLARVKTHFVGRPIFCNDSAPRDPPVGNDIPWSSSSSTATLVDTPMVDASPRGQPVQRRHPKDPMKPRDPYTQFRWGYGRHLFGPASRTDPPVVIPASGSDLFRLPKLSSPLFDPTFKSKGFYRRKSQEFEILNKEDESDDEFFDAEEFFDTGDTGDTEIVEAGPKFEIHRALTADEEEVLADAIRDDSDVESIRVEFRGMLARLDAEHRDRK